MKQTNKVGASTLTISTHGTSEQKAKRSKRGCLLESCAKYHLIVGGLCIVFAGFAMSPLLNRGSFLYLDPGIYAGITYILMGCVALSCHGKLPTKKLMGVLIASFIICGVAIMAIRCEIEITSNAKIIFDGMNRLMSNRLVTLELQTIFVLHVLLIILNCAELFLGITFLLFVLFELYRKL